MITLFHMWPPLGLLIGLGCGLVAGHDIWVFCFGQHFFRIGTVLGIILGGYVGYRIGWLPYHTANWYLMRLLAPKSTEQLWRDLYTDEVSIRDILRTLELRGEPLAEGLDQVLFLMDSENRQTRIFGFVAFLSVFPEYKNRLEDYRVDMPGEMRHRLLVQFRAMLPDKMQFKCDL